jgi:hypothetical protein
MDAAISPGVILSGQSKDDRDSPGRDAGPSRSVGLSPLAPDQVPVPPKQGLGLHEAPASTPAIEQSSQAGEQSTIRWLKSRSGDLTAKHGNLVAGA